MRTREALLTGLASWTSLGNGAAMRSAPVGLFLMEASNARAAASARNLASITHQREPAVHGAMFVALLVQMLARHRAQPRKALARLAQAAIDELPSYTPTVGDYQPSARGLMRKALELALMMGESMSAEECLHSIGTGFNVLETVPAAMMALVKTTSFEEAIRVAIYAGGDTDTTAAITGAFAGTYYGWEEVAPWARQIDQWERLRDLEVRLQQSFCLPRSKQ